MKGRGIPVALSTASVYPQTTQSAFQYAAQLGFDGIELMVWAEAASQDPFAVAALIDKYQVPVTAVHAPCLLISQRVWGSDPIPRLDRAVQVARQIGATTVVVHPPFVWQRAYARGFAAQVARLEDMHGVIVAVENMYPFRADRFLGNKEESVKRMRRRGTAGAGVSVFSPGHDPTVVDHRHYTLDLSHTATAGMDALELADRMGDGLAHVHLADGRGAYTDEHLPPGDGEQPCAELCHRLAERRFTGQVVLEINTQVVRTRDERAAELARSLAFARTHLTRVRPGTD